MSGYDPKNDDGYPYKVWAFFPDDTHLLIDEALDAEEAVRCIQRQLKTLGARLGTTQRLIIEDCMGYTAFEWTHGKGMTFPQTPANKEKPDG